MERFKRQWRLYRTAAGRSPVREFLDELTDADAAEVVAEMRVVAREGLRAARHLRGELYEVRATGENRIYRVIFATQGRYSQVLLALEGFDKKTQKTPAARLEVAEDRLADWKKRGRKK